MLWAFLGNQMAVTNEEVQDAGRASVREDSNKRYWAVSEFVISSRPITRIRAMSSLSGRSVRALELLPLAP
jgi:hypothetical protein